jgi:tRNA A37 threonylcarbamoyladenosine modification protein TsaB
VFHTPPYHRNWHQPLPICCKKAGASIQTVDTLAVATGPGSLPVYALGWHFAKGMALANHINLIGIPSLDILAFFTAVLLPFR